MKTDKNQIDQESLDAAKAQAFLEADREARAKACDSKIKAALAEYNCDLIARPVLTDDGRIDAVALIRPK